MSYYTANRGSGGGQQPLQGGFAIGPGGGYAYPNTKSYNNPNTQFNNAFQQWIAAHQGQAPGPTPTSGDPNAANNATSSFAGQMQAILDALANPATPDESFSTPGGNVLSGSGGKKSGAGSNTLAKELQQKLQIMNLGEQQQLIALQQQQDPQLFQLQQQKFQDTLGRIGIQETAANQGYQNSLFGLNSSAAASGAYTSQGNNVNRTALSQQLQNQLGTLGLARQNVGIGQQTAQLNEDYNKAALASQAKMNFWERFAQGAQAGLFANGGLPSDQPTYGTKNLYGYTYTPYGWIQGK